MRITGITFFLLMLVSLQVKAQKLVKGSVMNTEAQPLAGVTVTAKGSNVSTTTDNVGNFSIALPSKSTALILSYVGKKTKEVVVNGEDPITVVLENDIVGMDEVVAIGYGSSRKRDLQGAVTTIKVGDNFQGRSTSIGNILQGQVPGVNITQTGDPTQGASVQIRGKGNKNGDAVLYVVDGVPGAPFNGSDIETVTVLKDASSAAIYGALAGSGGVILITTKQAKQGKATVDFSAWEGRQKAWRLPKVLTAEEFNKVWKDASDAAGKTVPKAYNPVLFPYGNVTRTDWLDAIFRTGKVNHYDLTIRGGSKDVKSLASVSYDKTEGTLITTYGEKLTTRLGTDLQLNKWVSVSQNLVYDYSNGKSGIGDGHTGTIFGAMAYPRYSTVYEYDDGGNVLYGGTVPRWALAQGFSVEADLRNPVAMLEKVRQNNPQNRIFSASAINFNLMPGLTFKSNFAYDVTSLRGESFQMKFLEPGRTIDQNYRVISNSLFKVWNFENILNYQKLFNQVHSVSLMGAFTMNKRNYRYEQTEMRGFDFESEHSTIFPNGTNWTTKPYEEIWDEATVSAVGRASYSFDDRYFISASLRRDASSKLNPDKNWDIFPAVSGSWKISSEEFMNNQNLISFLKLRASWGQVGNINSVRRFIYAPPYQVTGWPVFLGSNGQVQGYGIYQPTIPNPNLRWERTEQTNIGADISFLQNSLNFTFDFFNKQTKDLIESMPVASVAGVASAPEFNIGRVENKGWEASANYVKQIGDFNLNIGANIAHFKNTVKDIGANAFISHNNDVNSMKPLRSTVGQPWFSYFLIESAGLFRNQQEIDNYTWTDPKTNAVKKIQPNAKPGDLKFIDADNNGIINDADRKYMGAYDMPNYTYGMNLGAGWKNINLNVTLMGVSGVKIFNGVKAMTYTGSKGWNMSTDVLNSYNYNSNSDIPRLAIVEDPNGNFSKVSDYFLEKGDFMRLKSLNLSYEFPQRLIQGTFLAKTKIRLFVNGENLVTFTSYSAFDPEVGNQGVDGGRFPVAKMYSAGINLTF